MFSLLFFIVSVFFVIIQCETIFYMKSSLGENNKMTKLYNVDLLDCSSHLLNGLNGELNTLISNAYYRYAKQIRFNVVMPSTCVNVCKTLTSISSSVHSCQSNGNFNYKNTKRIDETYILCGSNPTCNTAVNDLKKDSRSIYLFILDSNVKISGSIPSYARTTSLSSLSSRLLCPQNYALTPLPFYFNKLSSCGCFCPVGYTLQKGECVKIPSVRDINQQCQWIQKQFTYLQSDYCEKGKCEIRDLFNKIGLTTLPFPDDTYLNFAVNAGDFSQQITGPRIVLEITKEIGVNTEVKNWFTPRTFTWKDFQMHRESIFSNYIRLDSAGKYVITLKAYGYSEKPAICTTIISAKDNFLPKVVSKTVTCPTVCSKTAPMSYDNYVSAKKSIDNFNLWSSSVVNDAFGSNKRCDKVEYKVQNIGDNKLNPSCNSINLLEFKEQEIKNMKQTLSSLSLSNELVKMNDGYCTKCFSLFHAPAELTTFYDFPTPKSKVGTWTVDKCVSGTNCSISQCLTLNSNELFTITAGITSSYVNSTKALMSSRFSTVGYNPENEIHLSPACSDLKQSTCQFKDLLRNLITIKSSFRSNWSTVLGKLVPETSALLRYRYNVNGGKWEEFTLTSTVVLSELVNTITIEAYSACGKVGKALTIKVTLHTVKAVSICDNMEKLGWFQSTTGAPLNGETRISNYPGADFGQFGFSYDGISESSSMSMTSFDSITCSISYIINNTVSKPVVIIPKTNKIVIEHFAVNLVRSPTTMETTKLRMSCTSTFINSNKQAVSSTCNKDIIFHYTNEVQWNCPNGDCLLKCPINQPRPGQICKGKVISHVNGQTLYENIEQPKPCCKSCGNNYQCRPLSSSEPLGLMQCTNDDPITITSAKLFAAPNHYSSETQIFPSFFVVAGISIMGIALIVAYRRKRKMSRIAHGNDDDNYRILLA